VSLTTPGEQQCTRDKAAVEAKLAAAEARLELLIEAKNACKDALNACGGGS
jgi:hypothetical protein